MVNRMKILKNKILVKILEKVKKMREGISYLMLLLKRRWQPMKKNEEIAQMNRKITIDLLIVNKRVKMRRIYIWNVISVLMIHGWEFYRVRQSSTLFGLFLLRKL